MFLFNYRLSIVIAFVSIFSVKMLISATPIFVCIDKDTMKSVIMQLEQEHPSDGDVKDSLKLIDSKLIHQYAYDAYIPVLQDFGVKNCYIDHFKRYVNSFYPSIPTPPPNFSYALQS